MRGLGVVAALAVAGSATMGVARASSAPRAPQAAHAQAPPTTSPTDVAAGRQLYLVACTTCHGPEGAGTKLGPPLLGVGAASAHFYLSTGRMPLDRPRAQAERKRVAYTPTQVRQLVAYVASLGPGLPIPTVDEAAGDLSLGNRLYANNCAPCHSSAGAGGALGHAVYAPALNRATPVQIAEAIRIGPGSMPVFGPDTLDDHQVTSIVRYVTYLRHPDDRGGLGLGHLGPIPEGFVAWVVGLGALLLAARWIGTRD